MSYTARRWWGSDIELQNAKTKALESIENEHAHSDSSVTTSRAVTCHIGRLLKRSAATTLTGHPTDSNIIHLSTNFGILSFDFILYITANTYSHLLTLSCLRGSVGIYYSIFGTT